MRGSDETLGLTQAEGATGVEAAPAPERLGGASARRAVAGRSGHPRPPQGA